MARLILEAGPISAEKSADNAKADRVISACAMAFGYTGDLGAKQAVADFFLTALVRRLEDLAVAYERDKATATAAGTVEANRPSWGS